MFSIASSNSQRVRTARPNTVLVLEPPRHTRWPLVFLGPGKHLIGSSADAAIRVDAEGVQPSHAMILVGDHKILLKALDSKTWVNDGAATETMLRPGDRISIGPITFLARPASARELEDYQQTEEPANEEPVAPQPANIVSDALPVPAPSILAPTPIESRHEAAVVAEPLVDELRASAESTFQEIHRHLESLHEPIEVPSIAPARATLENEARIQAREDQLNQLAAELARQSQRLRDQATQIAEREAELEQKQITIASENERLITAAQSTRNELAAEHARQMSLWQEWDAAYKRSSEELKQQLQTIEKRRTELQAENERFSAERLSIQQLQAECESERRQVASDRVQTTTELGDLHTNRAAFETERRELLVSIQERELAIANERRMLATSHGDLVTARQQFEHERTLFAAERSAESLRREQDLHEQTLTRIRLTDQESELQAKLLEVDAAKRQIELERATLQRDHEVVDTERSEMHELLARVHQLESELEFSRQSRQELQAAVDELQLDAERIKSELDVTLSQYEADHAALEQERHHGQNERSEIDELRSRVQSLEAELESNGKSKDDLQQAADRLQLETSRRTTEFEEWQQAIDFQHTQLDSVRQSLQQEQEKIRSAWAELEQATQRRSLETVSSAAPLAESEPVPPPVSPAVERLMGIVSEHKEAPSSGSLESDRLPSYFAQTNTPRFKDHPPASAGETAFFAGDSPTSASENAETTCELSHVLAQITAHPPRVETSEVGGPHCEFESEEFVGETDGLSTSELAEDSISEPLPDVDRTLTAVNEQFGYVSSLLNHYLSPLPTELGSASKSEETSASLPEIVGEKDSTELPYRVSEESVPSLRAQLAEMFDLPENPRDAVDEMKESGFGIGAEEQPSGTLGASALSILDDLDREKAESESGPRGLLSEFTTSADENLFRSSTEESAAAESECSKEEPWARRLRELAQIPDPTPPMAIEVAPPAEPESKPSAQSDDDFSVEAQLARLLGRPYRSESPAPEKPRPEAVAPKPVVKIAEPSYTSDDNLIPIQAVDRSHLSEAPKHKTDRTAIRDEVQSFREVAQMSARTALAKHSLTNLKNEFYFISALTAAASIATAWYLGTFLLGSETDPWKGVTCAIATILCSHRMVKASAKLNQWHRANRKSQKDFPDTAPPSVAPPKIASEG